uniref:Col_cuticle_N domain-containing protein n=1 Tax=Pristionchus pacificus TaxID=54126 RepID=A0A2A6BRR6_PRIPA|eukprot:PDM68567.1 hypothetical protein PRIPAC_44069 [Pristionchus pacificus]
MDTTGIVVGMSTLLLGIFYSTMSIGYLSSEVASLWSELDQEMGVLKVETDDLWVRIVQLGDPARGTIRRARRDYEKVIEGYNAKVEVPVFETDSITGKSESGDIPTLPPLLAPPKLDTCVCNAMNTCAPGAPGQPGEGGEDGIPGVDGQDGFHGIDAVDSQNDGFYGCVVCPTGAPGLKGRQGHSGEHARSSRSYWRTGPARSQRTPRIPR